MPRKPTHLNIKQDLIRALRTLINKEGLDGLDVRKIAKEAGCSIGTFYNHYKSMDDLVVHFNGETLDLLQANMFDTITSNDTPKEVFKKICCNYIDFAKNSHSAWLLLLEYPISIQPPDWYENKVNQLFRKVSAIFHPILKGKKADTERAVKILWGSLHGICSLMLKSKLRFPREEDTAELCQELFYYYTLGHRVASEIH